MRNPRMSRSREQLTSPWPVFLARLLLVALAVYSIHNALTGIRVFYAYDIRPGSLLWVAAVLDLALYVIAVACIAMTFLRWKWAIWIWVLTISAVTAGGVFVGLDASFLLRWEVAVPWVLLVIAAVSGTRYAAPWRII